jgi:single-stranded DNA-binding protein
MRLVVNRSRDRDTADFFDVVAWEGLGEVCAEHREEGRRVAVSGRVQYRQWKTDDGQPRHSYEVVAHDVESLDAIRREVGQQAADDGGERAPGRVARPRDRAELALERFALAERRLATLGFGVARPLQLVEAAQRRVAGRGAASRSARALSRSEASRSVASARPATARARRPQPARCSP